MLTELSEGQSISVMRLAILVIPDLIVLDRQTDGHL